jgi:mRNA-degrading endonuclease toxin of MazEF toxin-antitoxin module
VLVLALCRFFGVVARVRPEGLPARSVVNLDNLHTVRKSQPTKRLGSLGSTREAEVKRSLGHALGWLELIRL